MKLFAVILCLAAVICFVTGFPRKQNKNVEDFSNTVYAASGTITSAGYPNGYGTDDGDSWKFRVEGAQLYTIMFNEMDLDQAGCWDYIVIYDDTDYAAPGNILCELPDAPIIVQSSKITVSFVTASAFTAGKRGAGFSFSYAINGNIPTTSTTTLPISTTEQSTSTVASTSTVGSTSTVASTSTVGSTTTTSATTTSAEATLPVSSTTPSNTVIPPNGNFPPGSQDDSMCGLSVVKPVISGLDYEAQGNLLSGYQLPANRVVNGETAQPHSWPWQVSLQGSYGSAYCGGTLVRDQWVVTAAHCAALIFVGTYGSDQVGLGMHDKSIPEASRQLIDVAAVYTHPQYDNPDRSHDVAMVKLATPAILNDDVSLACEAHPGWTFPAGMQCVVTGWGVTVEGGNRGTSILQQAPLPLMSDEDCFELYQQANLDTTYDMQCAGGQGKGACNGDSGGPLNCYVNDRWYHMGIVSFGEANCDTEIASVFAKVAELRGFIDDVIANYS